MRPLNLHFVGFSTVPGPGTMGGGTRIYLEFARRLQSRPDMRVFVYVSEAGLATCRANGLDDRTTFRTIPERIDNQFYSPAAHVNVSRAGLRAIQGIAAQAGDGPHVVYSGSNFWPDMAVGRRLAQQVNGLWAATVYLFAPSPFYGYLGHFSHKVHWPETLPLLSWLYERTFLPLIRRAAGMVFVTNDYDRPLLRGARAYPDHVHAVYGGVDLDEAKNSPPAPNANYAGAFVGRLHPMKGVAQLLQIWAYVVRQQPEARLALIGVGREDYVQEMRRLCSRLGLDGSVDWLGYCDGADKYAILKRTKVFLHTSIYDNNGMVACEAMSVGLPVVLFDLPPLRIAYPTGALRAPLGDNQGFAECVLRLLSDEPLRLRLGQEGLALAAHWNWDARTETALGQIKAALAADPAP